MKQLIIDGKKYAKELEENLKLRVDTLKVKPKLATVLVGNDPSSVTYVNMKVKACERVGIIPLKVCLSENTSFNDLLNEINKLNNDDSIDGILIQHPLPNHIDEDKIFDEINIKKDVDGLNSYSFGKVAYESEAFYSATPLAILSLLKEYNIPLEDKNVVVVGRSRILGKPVAMIMINENSNVTICHSKTTNLKEYTKNADIIIAAIGKPCFIKKDMIKKGCVLIDSGYNSGNVGDIDPLCYKKSGAYTPVPGGVGPVTIMKLLEQVVISKERKENV